MNVTTRPTGNGSVDVLDIECRVIGHVHALRKYGGSPLWEAKPFVGNRTVTQHDTRKGAVAAIQLAAMNA